MPSKRKAAAPPRAAASAPPKLQELLASLPVRNYWTLAGDGPFRGVILTEEAVKELLGQ
jgi:hypothetical protein